MTRTKIVSQKNFWGAATADSEPASCRFKMPYIIKIEPLYAQ